MVCIAFKTRKYMKHEKSVKPDGRGENESAPLSLSTSAIRHNTENDLWPQGNIMSIVAISALTLEIRARR